MGRVEDGENPMAGLIFDAAGNLYGTTAFGGLTPQFAGIVFRLTPNADGTWVESVLHRFHLTDGKLPLAGLIFDAAGNLYGTTRWGGGGTNCPSEDGCGTVFKLTHNADGSWSYTKLHSFNALPGKFPTGDLVLDAAGNLYGTAYAGGPADGGVVFRLTHNPDGSWGYSVLHVFLGKPALDPFLGGLVLDKVGNLYGVTAGCASGTGCQGVVYEITQ